jgi:hypothetical protein
MKQIVKTVFGSHLYGTSTPESDKDFKAVHMYSLSEIVLKKDKEHFDNSTNKKTKNTKDDIDFESYELRHFINSCLLGDTHCQNMIWTPENLILETSDVWEDLIQNRGKLKTNRMGSYIGYCSTMAKKYALKSEKLEVLYSIFGRLDSVTVPKMRIDEFFSHNEDLLLLEFTKKYYKQIGNGGEFYFDIVSKTFPASRPVLEVKKVVCDMIEQFGERVKKAVADGKIDLKSYYHAVRVVFELEEMLNEGNLTFPNPRADFLLKIRNGEFEKKWIEHFLCDEIERVLKIPNNLPEPDFDFWNEWILDKYGISPKENPA